MIPFFMKKLFVILSVFFSSSLYSQFIELTPGLQTAFNKVMELKLLEAETIITNESNAKPDNLATSYLTGAIISVKMFINDDIKVFEKERVGLEKCITKLEKASDNDPQKRLMISEMRLSLAILHAKYHNNIRAGLQFYKAYNLLESNYKKFPEYAPTYVPLGVLYAAIGSLPEGYQSIASVIGITGSVEKGMGLIKKGYWRTISDRELRFYRDYFGFIYSYTSLKLKGNTDVSPESLSLDYKRSSYLTYMQCLVEVDKGNARKAVNLLKERPTGQEYFTFDFLDYYTGKIALPFSADTAYIYLNQFLANTESDNYKKSTYRYLSWYAMLKNKPDDIEKYRSKVNLLGSLNTGADRQALREAKVPFNEILTKGRILFDGGLYEEGAEFLKAKEPQLAMFSKGEQIEYYYRLGRIYQESIKPNLAIKYFKKALAIPMEAASFSKGNSALQIALVYEEIKDKPTAKKYFNEALSYKSYPFYEGVHQQAKAGLDRL